MGSTACKSVRRQPARCLTCSHFLPDKLPVKFGARCRLHGGGTGEYRRDLARSAICLRAAHFPPITMHDHASGELDLNGPFSEYRVCYDSILSALCSSSAAATERCRSPACWPFFSPARPPRKDRRNRGQQGEEVSRMRMRRRRRLQSVMSARRRDQQDEDAAKEMTTGRYVCRTKG